MHVCVFFFFFQAEDGIRDTSVTGVQTCALPISTQVAKGLPGGFGHDHGGREPSRRQPYVPVAAQRHSDPWRDAFVLHDCRGGRSEERRVGKEWSSRRGPCPMKRQERKEGGDIPR